MLRVQIEDKGPVAAFRGRAGFVAGDVAGFARVLRAAR